MSYLLFRDLYLFLQRLTFSSCFSINISTSSDPPGVLHLQWPVLSTLVPYKPYRLISRSSRHSMTFSACHPALDYAQFSVCHPAFASRFPPPHSRQSTGDCSNRTPFTNKTLPPMALYLSFAVLVLHSSTFKQQHQTIFIAVYALIPHIFLTPIISPI